ncbi:hypothetical protein SASPL_103543 [Salvia splendens]|uniref:Solute carrier family 15 (Peptide/histidine transporter), member 3/4 n=1 Tax=Salvia splendens TaxID=180675 RepID=A0A8X8YL69_SALSN|nr:hypothetical protein SASPL_103543 [Salvia splendens]
MAENSASAAESDAMEAQAPLLVDAVRGCVDFKGRRVLHSKSGCWKSASFIIGVEMAERFAYYGISSNMVTYLTGPLGQSTAAAAANVNAWAGATALMPLLGAFVADSFLGRFWTIIAASLLYILGLGSLSVSAALNPSDSSSPPLIDVIFFFFALYLIAFAVGGHKPCLQAFGADQFDDENERELRSKSSFFNWWIFCLCISTLVGLLVLTYIQENLSWALGFGIPCIVMCFALFVFVLGIGTYRFRVQSDGRRNPFVRIVRALKNRHAASPECVAIEEEGARFRLPGETVPMSAWWLIPQYLVMGVADVLTFVGLQEFLYDQVPSELKSTGLALSFAVVGIGGFLSSFLVSVVDKATGGEGRDSWLSDNLNRGHLDYFYWVLAGLNALSLVCYIYLAKSYV